MGAGRGSRSEQRADDGRIALCAADETIRARIEAALAFGGYETAVTGTTVEELIDTARQTPPALQILACQFEPFMPTDQLGPVRSELGDTPLIVVAVGFLGAACRKLVRREVDGLVHEAQIEEALVATVDAVLADQLCFPASMRGTVAGPVFSHREKQVLELLLAGLTNGEIAAQLYLSESTVKSHLASTFRKLGVSSRVEAARRVLAPDVGLEVRQLVLDDRRPTPSVT
jgi:DNA-binding NarL/FixJ family response regulator